MSIGAHLHGVGVGGGAGIGQPNGGSLLGHVPGSANSDIGNGHNGGGGGGGGGEGSDSDSSEPLDDRSVCSNGK